jgi:ribose transport system substrate-binding protein
MAVDLLDGKDVESPMVIPTSIVDRDNYMDYIDANSPY